MKGIFCGSARNLSDETESTRRMKVGREKSVEKDRKGYKRREKKGEGDGCSRKSSSERWSGGESRTPFFSPGARGKGALDSVTWSHPLDHLHRCLCQQQRYFPSPQPPFPSPQLPPTLPRASVWCFSFFLTKDPLNTSAVITSRCPPSFPHPVQGLHLTQATPPTQPPTNPPAHSSSQFLTFRSTFPFGRTGKWAPRAEGQVHFVVTLFYVFPPSWPPDNPHWCSLQECCRRMHAHTGL